MARCLHFGSRPNPKSKSRLILWFVYHHYCGDVFPFSMMADKRFDFKESSMGMSSDYLHAIKHNTTYLRIGTSIFGERTI